MIKSTQGSPLFSISPLDGRYQKKTQPLSEYLSEYALIKTRIEVEIAYLLQLSKYKIIRKITIAEKKKLYELQETFNLQFAEKVKEIESETRHDVKAVERYIRIKLEKTSLNDVIEFVHFGLTSEDINNISYRLMLKRGIEKVILPEYVSLLKSLKELSNKTADVAMLARTHGQSAVPTTLGKEIAVFVSRLEKEIIKIDTSQLTGKLNGAVGNFNALVYVYPKVNWIKFSDDFISQFLLVPNILTTQINTYEDVITIFQSMQRANSVLIDLNQDMWRYISDNWFIQKFKTGEVGSSTMPQKVNPIDFENSEGNLGMANAVIEHFVRKLPISRLQRDLTDSTVIRNIGVVLGYEIVALESLKSGLLRVEVNKKEIEKQLEKDWSILTEGVQTYLRNIGIKDPYVLVAKLTKGKMINKDEWAVWIKELPIEAKHKAYLNKLTPQIYIGLAKEIVKKTLK